jgi:hypothetical protein
VLEGCVDVACHNCAGYGRLYTALYARLVMSVIGKRTDTYPVRLPRSTPCITCNAAVVFSLRETVNSANRCTLRGAGSRSGCEALPLYVVFGGKYGMHHIRWHHVATRLRHDCRWHLRSPRDTQRLGGKPPLSRIYAFAPPYADILSVSHPSPSRECLVFGG